MNKNSLNWHHIMDKQPKQGEYIIQCDPPYQGHCLLGRRKYDVLGDFEGIIRWNSEHDWPQPNYHWISADDFPFPEIAK